MPFSSKFDMKNQTNQIVKGKIMIKVKNPNQLNIFDPWDFLTPKRRQMLESGWPGLFREHILPSRRATFCWASKEILADSLYGSDDNCERAKKHNVELIAPTMGSVKEDKLSLADFIFSQKGELIAPTG